MSKRENEFKSGFKTEKLTTAATSADGYKFTVTNGVVSGVAEVEHGRTKNKLIKSYEQYQVDGANIVKSEAKGAWSELATYSDSNNDGIFQKVSEASVLNPVNATSSQIQAALYKCDHMKFTLDASGTVTSAIAISKNGIEFNAINPKVSFTEQSGFIVKTSTSFNSSKWEVFADGNADGIYTEVAHGSGAAVDLVGLSAQINPIASML